MAKNGMRALLAELEAQGWRVKRTSGNHIKCIPPDRDAEIVILPSTPSDHRAMANAMAKLRRSGFRQRKSSTKKEEKR